MELLGTRRDLGWLFGPLDRRQEKGRQDCDRGDDDQKFYESKRLGLNTRPHDEGTATGSPKWYR